jgi:hypothetical protein
MAHRSENVRTIFMVRDITDISLRTLIHQSPVLRVQTREQRTAAVQSFIQYIEPLRVLSRNFTEEGGRKTHIASGAPSRSGHCIIPPQRVELDD